MAILLANGGSSSRRPALGFAVLAGGVSGLLTLLWLRSKRLLGFPLVVRRQLRLHWTALEAQPEPLPRSPSASWLAEQRQASLRETGAEAPIERLLGTWPWWLREGAAAGQHDSVESSLDGAPIPIRIYRPLGRPRSGATCVYLHGGGWVFGGYSPSHGTGSHDHIAKCWAARAGIVVVMVDYRLSPEYKYPVPLQDCLDALHWCSARTCELGGDAGQFFVAGDSAGGNLAVAACLKARDEAWKGFALGVHALRGMIVAYPCVSRMMVNERGGSYERFDRFCMSGKDMAWYWEMYLGVGVDAPLDRNVERYAAPLDAASVDWRDLPPALLLFADHDVLLDEGALLELRLRDAGVAVESSTVPYTLHGAFRQRSDPSAFEHFMAQCLAWIRATPAR